ncbi:hypothetical protein [Streptomyces sp. NPDC048411]
MRTRFRIELIDAVAIGVVIVSIAIVMVLICHHWLNDLTNTYGE